MSRGDKSEALSLPRRAKKLRKENSRKREKKGSATASEMTNMWRIMIERERERKKEITGKLGVAEMEEGK